MENQPQNPEFRNNPENFHPCVNTLTSKQVDELLHLHISLSHLSLASFFMEPRKQSRPISDATL